ncbi:hypothetical protein AVEN_112720-1, partial [Araneus ventricosus]
CICLGVRGWEVIISRQIRLLFNLLESSNMLPSLPPSFILIASTFVKLLGNDEWKMQFSFLYVSGHQGLPLSRGLPR